MKIAIEVLRQARDQINQAIDKLEEAKPKQYGWTGTWADDWHGKNLICEKCSTKNCSVRAFATRITTYPEYEIGTRLETACGWTFLYARKPYETP